MLGHTLGSALGKTGNGLCSPCPVSFSVGRCAPCGWSETPCHRDALTDVGCTGSGLLPALKRSPTVLPTPEPGTRPVAGVHTRSSLLAAFPLVLEVVRTDGHSSGVEEGMGRGVGDGEPSAGCVRGQVVPLRQ